MAKMHTIHNHRARMFPPIDMHQSQCVNNTGVNISQDSWKQGDSILQYKHLRNNNRKVPLYNFICHEGPHQWFIRVGSENDRWQTNIDTSDDAVCQCLSHRQWKVNIELMLWPLWFHHIFSHKILWDLVGFLYPPFNEVDRGVYWYHLVRLSVCPSVRLSVCPSVDRIVSALYLQEYSSDPFHICTSYPATSEGVSRVMRISKFKKLKFWQFF